MKGEKELTLSKEKCTVRDGRFVEPCEDLNQQCELGNPPPGKSRGIYEWRYTNTRTGEESRAFFGAKTSARPQGLLFNFCPWCGERIDAPFVKTPAPAAEIGRTQEAAHG